MIGETKGSLVNEPGALDPISAEQGTKPDDERVFLSEIIKKINEVYGQQLTDEHRVMLHSIRKRLHEDEVLKKFMSGDNSETNKRKKFIEILEQTLLSYVNNQFDFYQKLENPQVKSLLIDEFYRMYGRNQ
jgi:hypothetical protein